MIHNVHHIPKWIQKITFVTWFPHESSMTAEVIEKVRPDGLFAAFGEDLRELQPRLPSSSRAPATTATTA